MNNLESHDVYTKKYPHYKTYAQCQSRAFATSTFAMLAGTAGGYISQELLKNYLWYSRKSFLLPSILIGSCTGYIAIRHQTKICQEMWMALEDKHTSLQTAEERIMGNKTSDKT
ncbi:uncharacterized protein LOC135470462 [Liolophura sinensis]|uniref:uncharacterized protein LOC135470462 n=1 Tax=Liolophura sinensis TaxID=3198878 RepID=UPI003158FF64